ncbi:MAG: NERD domain-containing protein [Gammaproteobacteria bacterium]|nr:NERD domain-containing protein [Gammaproteobacteria bacterium]
MSEQLQSLKEFTINNPDLVTWTMTGLLVLVGMLLQKAWIKEYISGWKLKHLLRNIGADSLHNVIIHDEMDGKIFIENLILMPDRILILGVKKYKGLIFAADNIDLWTQVIGNKSYKFDNPLRQLESDALTLNSKIENSKIQEKVLFIHGAEFPKGKPENVLEIMEVSAWRNTSAHTDIPGPLLADWKKLQELVLLDDRDKELFMGDDNTAGLNLFSLLSIVMITTLWLVWRLA